MPKGCPAWLSNAVFYQIYPPSFYDSNADGIGDINGIIQKLDYIKNLGCDAIWLNPCFCSPFNDGGYDITDYYKVAPRYGTNSDLQRLFRAAEKLNIKVCLDLVPAHTSIEHPWFSQSAKAQKNKYSDWYIWTDSVWEQPPKEFRFIQGYGQRDGSYMTSFFWSQPALNFGFAKPDAACPWQLPVDHPAAMQVQNEMIKVMRYWLDRGACGFRVDMASTIIKNDPNQTQTKRFWRRVREMFDRKYPEAVLISEWSYPSAAIDAGFHIDFMIHIGDSLPYNSLFRLENDRSLIDLSNGHSFFSKDGRGDITQFVEGYLKHYRKIKNKGYISVPTGNHDLPRISIGRSYKEIELVFAMLLTLPSVPFIYYGDEIGMKQIAGLASKEGGYGRTGCRTPMQFNSSKNAGFSNAPPDRLYLPVDAARNRPNAAKQLSQKKSLLNVVRELIALRKSSPALCADGSFEIIYANKKKYPFVYIRRLKSQRFLIALNPSGKKVVANLPAIANTNNVRLKIGQNNKLSQSAGRFRIQMAPVSYSVFEL